MSPVTVINVVRALVDVILALVPPDVAKQVVDDAAVRRAHAMADAAEAAKFAILPDLDDPGEEPTKP